MAWSFSFTSRSWMSASVLYFTSSSRILRRALAKSFRFRSSTASFSASVKAAFLEVLMPLTAAER